MALSPDGGALAVHTLDDGVKVVSLPDGREVVSGWRPFGPGPGLEGTVAWMAFLTEKKLVAANGKGKLGLWEVPGRRAVYQGRQLPTRAGQLSPGFPDPAGLALSPD